MSDHKNITPRLRRRLERKALEEHRKRAQKPLTAPCGQCPFRPDAPLGIWAKAHYLMLGEMCGVGPRNEGMFECHQDRLLEPYEGRICAGWLLWQREHGTPSLGLRAALGRGEVDPEVYEQISGDIFEDAGEMVRANLAAYDRIEDSTANGTRCEWTGRVVRDAKIGATKAKCPGCGQTLPYGKRLPAHEDPANVKGGV